MRGLNTVRKYLQEFTGNSLLHRAAAMYWKDDLDWLIKHDANMNALNKDGDTTLMSALKLKRLAEEKAFRLSSRPRTGIIQ
jgi:ankyrin repeat protein